MRCRGATVAPISGSRAIAQAGINRSQLEEVVTTSADGDDRESREFDDVRDAVRVHDRLDWHSRKCNAFAGAFSLPFPLSFPVYSFSFFHSFTAGAIHDAMRREGDRKIRKIAGGRPLFFPFFSPVFPFLHNNPIALKYE
jgi:hypothetical protein